jgi:hypothetical protein
VWAGHSPTAIQKTPIFTNVKNIQLRNIFQRRGHPSCHCENLPTSLGYQKIPNFENLAFYPPPLHEQISSLINFLRIVIPIFVELLVQPTDKKGFPFSQPVCVLLSSFTF